MVSAQETNHLPEDASHNDAIFPKSLYLIYRTTSQCLSSYGCTITVVYILLRIYTIILYLCINVYIITGMLHAIFIMHTICFKMIAIILLYYRLTLSIMCMTRGVQHTICAQINIFCIYVNTCYTRSSVVVYILY